jgi:hypothetical protein
VCDVSYLLQIRAIEREALALQVLAPHLEQGAQLPSPAEAIAEFDAWLTEEPPEERPLTGADMERAELYEAMGVRRRG